MIVKFDLVVLYVRSNSGDVNFKGFRLFYVIF